MNNTTFSNGNVDYYSLGVFLQPIYTKICLIIKLKQKFDNFLKTLRLRLFLANFWLFWLFGHNHSHGHAPKSIFRIRYKLEGHLEKIMLRK